MAFLIFAATTLIMIHSIYTGNDQYIDIVLISQTLMIILCLFAAPLVAIISHTKIEKDEIKVNIRKWIKPSMTKSALGWACLSLNVVLFYMVGFKLLIVFYLLTAVWVKICRAISNQSL
ncbi:TMhelix containing protein [Vibrio phage 1.123.O._10N.286.48.F3]|nr:TMhelix containing protein [Vibrio phage 1.123.O._10N.286.48.F3]